MLNFIFGLLLGGSLGILLSGLLAASRDDNDKNNDKK